MRKDIEGFGDGGITLLDVYNVFYHEFLIDFKKSSLL